MTPCPPVLYVYAATVVEATDGDTVVLCVDYGFRGRLDIEGRMKGVYSPEKDQPRGPEDTANLRTLLPAGVRVTVRTTKVTPRVDKGRPVKFRETLARYVVEVWDAAGADVNAAQAAFIGTPGGIGVVGLGPGVENVAAPPAGQYVRVTYGGRGKPAPIELDE